MPSPHTAGLHVSLRQIFPCRHDVPASGAEPGMQVCCAVHVAVPLHGSPVLQGPLSGAVQVQVQSLLHPWPLPLAEPWSHCSGGSTMPSPQTAVVASSPVSSPPSDDVMLVGEAPPQPVNAPNVMALAVAIATASHRKPLPMRPPQQPWWLIAAPVGGLKQVSRAGSMVDGSGSPSRGRDARDRQSLCPFR